MAVIAGMAVMKCMVVIQMLWNVAGRVKSRGACLLDHDFCCYRLRMLDQACVWLHRQDVLQLSVHGELFYYHSTIRFYVFDTKHRGCSGRFLVHIVARVLRQRLLWLCVLDCPVRRQAYWFQIRTMLTTFSIFRQIV